MTLFELLMMWGAMCTVVVGLAGLTFLAVRVADRALRLALSEMRAQHAFYRYVRDVYWPERRAKKREGVG